MSVSQHPVQDTVETVRFAAVVRDHGVADLGAPESRPIRRLRGGRLLGFLGVPHQADALLLGHLGRQSGDDAVRTQAQLGPAISEGLGNILLGYHVSGHGLSF